MSGESKREDDVIDRIDELVDEQLAAYPRRTGYDHNVSQPRCPYCSGEFHGLPITWKVHDMRLRYCGCSQCRADLAAYRADDDDSMLWCPGSTFIGPWATPEQLAAIRAGVAGGEDVPARFQDLVIMPDGSITGTVTFSPYRTFTFRIEDMEYDEEPDDELDLDYVLSLISFCFGMVRTSLDRTWVDVLESMQNISDTLLGGQIVVDRWVPGDDPLPDVDPEPDIPTPEQRALPRPTTEPPMWAIQPNRRNRRRNR